MLLVFAAILSQTTPQPPAGVFLFVALYCCQAVLLTEDVDIIVQHLTGVLQSLAKKQQGSTKAIISSPNCSTLYGNQEVSALHAGKLRAVPHTQLATAANGVCAGSCMPWSMLPDKYA